MDKFQAEAILCKDGINCSNEHISGTWSTVYDQSFKIELENGLRFLANFRGHGKQYQDSWRPENGPGQKNKTSNGEVGARPF